MGGSHVPTCPTYFSSIVKSKTAFREISMMNRKVLRSENRTLLRDVLLMSLGSVIGTHSIGMAEESRIEIRQRTDPNVQSDIQAVLELQKRYLESKPPIGLSELATGSAALNRQANFDVAPASSTSSGPVYQVKPASPVVIGSCDSVVIGSHHEVVGQDVDAQRRPSLTPSSARVTVMPAPIPSRVTVTPSVPSTASNPSNAQDPLRILPPPRVTQIDSSQFNGVPGATFPPSITQRWRPVSAQVGVTDTESTIVPSLQGSVRVGDSAVTQAAFQQAPGGIGTPPNMGAPPAMIAPQGFIPQGISPSPSNQSILPNNPAMGPINPSLGSNSVPGTMTPYSNGAPPNYAPQPRSSITGGEPFVTGAPCQFDASYMVEPTCYMASTGSSCGDAVSRTQPTYPYTGVPNSGPPYTGIPGTIIPPTMMPNQVPSGLYSGNNSGFRPLLGFGQDNYNVQLGRGLIGQPVAYVVGQPFRNFLRYVFP